MNSNTKIDNHFLTSHEIFSIKEKNINQLGRLLYIGQLIDIVNGEKIEGLNYERLNISEIKEVSYIILKQINEVLGKNPEELRGKTIESVTIKIGDNLINNQNLLDFAIGNYIKRVAFQVSNIHLRYGRYKKHLENKKLKIENKTDDLTKLSTKAYINEYLEKIIENKNKGNDNLDYGIILLDIDFFKIVNDNFGHTAGDIVLEEISKILKIFFRETDEVARWGGEEFFIIMKGGNQKEYNKKMENVRKYIEDKLINIVNNRIKKEGKISEINLNNITISTGITTLTSDDCVTSVTKRADEALYSAKRSGRNTIIYMEKYNKNKEHDCNSYCPDGCIEGKKNLFIKN